MRINRSYNIQLWNQTHHLNRHGVALRAALSLDAGTYRAHIPALLGTSQHGIPVPAASVAMGVKLRNLATSDTSFLHGTKTFTSAFGQEQTNASYLAKLLKPTKHAELKPTKHAEKTKLESVCSKRLMMRFVHGMMRLTRRRAYEKRKCATIYVVTSV